MHTPAIKPFFPIASVCLLVILLSLGGCALPAPLSEGIIFSEPGDYGSTTKRVGPIRVGDMGFSMAYTAFPASFERRARERFGSKGDTLNLLWRISGLFPSFSFAIADRGATAVTPGLGHAGLSADATVRVLGQSYLTLNANLMGNHEAIMQHRLLYANKRGVSMGGYSAVRGNRRTWEP